MVHILFAIYIINLYCNIVNIKFYFYVDGTIIYTSAHFSECD